MNYMNMNKPTYKIAAVLALSFLAACSNKNDDNGKRPAADTIPTALQFSKPAVGAELTREQAALIKKEFTVKSTMILPPGELIFPDKNMSPEELAKKEEALKNRDPNSFALLTDLRRDCRKGHPNIKYDLTFPAEQVVDESNLLVGDKAVGSASAGLIGTNCPVDFSGGIGANAEITDKNDQQKEITGKAGFSMKLNSVMKNPKYAKLLGARGMIVDSSVSGLAARRSVVTNKHDRALITFKMTGSYFSLNSNIPYSMEVKALLDSNVMPPVKSSSDIIQDIKLQMPNFSVNLVVHQIMKNDTQVSTEFYLNGHPKTEAELNELFGTNIPGSQPRTNPVIQALK